MMSFPAPRKKGGHGSGRGGGFPLGREVPAPAPRDARDRGCVSGGEEPLGGPGRPGAAPGRVGRPRRGLTSGARTVTRRSPRPAAAAAGEWSAREPPPPPGLGSPRAQPWLRGWRVRGRRVRGGGKAAPQRGPQPWAERPPSRLTPQRRRPGRGCCARSRRR